MPTDTKLLDAEGMLKEVFAEDCRPSVRWVRNQQKLRTIPFVKFGHFVLFDPVQVREAIQSRHTFKAKGI